MAVFLKILSIIGLIILGILALTVLILLLVLLVPIRYKADGSFKDNELKARAKVTWLLSFVSFKYVYGKEKPACLRVLGIKVWPKDKKPKDKKEKKTEEYTAFVKEQEIETKPVKEAVCEEKAVNNETVSLEEKEEIKDDFEESFTEEIDKDRNVDLDKKVSTKDNICDKIKKYIEIIQSDRFQNTYSYAKDKIKKLLKHILPRKWDINAVIGFEDPSVTGNILVYTSALYPFISKHIHVYGDFNNSIIDVNGKAKGRITCLKAAIIGAKLYFNKDIKKILKMFEEV